MIGFGFLRGPDTRSAQREFQELVRRRASGESGLVVSYFQQHPELDADLVLVQEAAAIVQSLYQPDVLDLIEKEGHLVELYGEDVRAVFKPQQRAAKISRIVLDGLKKYQNRAPQTTLRREEIGDAEDRQPIPNHSNHRDARPIGDRHVPGWDFTSLHINKFDGPSGWQQTLRDACDRVASRRGTWHGRLSHDSLVGTLRARVSRAIVCAISHNSYETICLCKRAHNEVIVPFLLDDPDLKNLDLRDAVLPHLRVLGDLLETYETTYADVDEDGFWNQIGSGFDSLILAPEEVWRWPLLTSSTDWQQHTDRLFAELEKRVRAPGDVTTIRPWHEVLEISETPSIEEIRAAYRAKIAQYHPDRVTGLGPEIREIAEQRSKEINHAYTEAQRARG